MRYEAAAHGKGDGVDVSSEKFTLDFVREVRTYVPSTATDKAGVV